MTASKRAHIEALTKHHAAPRTLAQRAYLAKLLADHDACVRRFGELVRALSRTDLVAHQALIAAINESNDDPLEQPTN